MRRWRARRGEEGRTGSDLEEAARGEPLRTARLQDEFDELLGLRTGDESGWPQLQVPLEVVEWPLAYDVLDRGAREALGDVLEEGFLLWWCQDWISAASP
jgi:hypothetical protein